MSSRYTLLEKLGAGGQAEVWRARDETAGIEVALKVLTPALARDEAAWGSLAREHAIASQLTHPAILKVYPPYREGDFAALPMELAAGGDLRRLRGGSYLDIVPVLIDIAQALEYAHEQGVIHRDLKPGNVLFDARGRVRLADFGVASAPGLPEAEGPQHGLSPFTASPEQLRGERPAISDDIYGLGALAYELLSGYPPYYPRFDVKRVLEEPVPELNPAQLMPPQLKAAVMRMLSKRPSSRPRSMRDVIDEFDSALNDTLTFDFERLDEPDPAASAMRRDASVIAAAEAARRGGSPSTVSLAATPAVQGGFDPSPAASESASRRTAVPAEQSGDFEPTIDAFTGQSAHPDVPASPVEQTPVLPPDAEPVRVVQARAGGSNVEAERIAAAAASLRDPPLSSGGDGGFDGPGIGAPVPHRWDDLQLQVQRTSRGRRVAEPARRRSWPWVLLAGVAATAITAFVVLPRFGAQIPGLGALELPIAASLTAGTTTPPGAPAVASSTPSGATPSSTPATAPDAVPARPEAETAPAPTAESITRLRAEFDQRLAALEERGAGVWGGPDFAAAKTRAAEAVGASDAGSPRIADERLKEALRLIGNVEGRAAQNLSAQLAAGDKALAAGQGEVARQAYESASRIDPNNRRAAEGLQRVRNLGGVLPLLADGENAEAEKDYARAVQDYSQALSLDPGNARARAGLDRAHAAFGQDTYARAVGAGFASLGAGRLEEARAAFEKARGIRPSGTEATTGLQQVGAALRARGHASARQKGAALEAEERWTDAFNEYDAALKADPSLVFAQQGRARAAARADLSNALQSLIDRPERLASDAVRAEAESLLGRAKDVDPTGPVLRSQIQRLQILLPEFDIPVKLELVSDNATQVAIQRVGTFGSFARREIELKPGKYTVVGTRPGFRDVRRDVTIAPGRDVQTISVSCVEPI